MPSEPWLSLRWVRNQTAIALSLDGTRTAKGPGAWLHAQVVDLKVTGQVCRNPDAASIDHRSPAVLESIPIAVLSAILAPGVAHASPAEAAGFLTALVAMRATGNDFAGAIGGVAAVALVRAL